jgi:hypothetical protein
LNFVPVDIYDLNVDKSVSIAIMIQPENYELDGGIFNLINVDLNAFRFRLVDGLTLLEVSRNYHWLLEAEISNAIIGKNQNGIIWYSGTWHCGRWFGQIWYSGTWVSGDWYSGDWYAFRTIFNAATGVQVDTSYVYNIISKWYNGRWFGGNWNGGYWYNGRRYAGNWKLGFWLGGIWNDGIFVFGSFQGGVWVNGVWKSGLFNCNMEQSYWLDGKFESGDFENGVWYNGQFGNDQSILSRFGTKATNTRGAIWHGGKWIDGEFHSNLNIDSDTGLPIVSEIHKFSIFRN